MYKVKVEGSIQNTEIKDLSPEQVEVLLTEKISGSILEGIEGELPNFSFIDIEQNIENESFDWHANIVVCAESQVSSSLAMVVTNLVSHGLGPEEIGKILEPLQNDMKGW